MHLYIDHLHLFKTFSLPDSQELTLAYFFFCYHCSFLLPFLFWCILISQTYDVGVSHGSVNSLLSFICTHSFDIFILSQVFTCHLQLMTHKRNLLFSLVSWTQVLDFTVNFSSASHSILELTPGGPKHLLQVSLPMILPFSLNGSSPYFVAQDKFS